MSICTYCLINCCNRCLRKECGCAHLQRTLGDVVRKEPVAGQPTGPTLNFAWGKLPRSKRPRRTEDALRPALEHLKDKPGEWASIAEYPRAGGANNAARMMREFGYVDWEFTTRKTDEGSSVLWARYLG